MFKLSDVVFILLINVKMPTTVGILTYLSMINFMLSCVDYEKSFITSGPDLDNNQHVITLIRTEVISVSQSIREKRLQEPLYMLTL